MKSIPKLVFCSLCFCMFQTFLPSSILKAQKYVKSDFKVSDETGFIYTAPHLSVNDNGEMVVVWETSGVGDISLKLISFQGEVLSDQISVKTPFSTMNTRVSHNGIGNFMVIFGALMDSWSVMEQTYSSTGDPLGDTLMVDRNTTEMIRIDKATINSNSENQFGAFLPGSDSMIVEIFSETGEYLNNTVVLKPETTSSFEMVGQMTYKGDLILVWLDNADGNFWGRIYTGDGTPSGNAFQISEKGPDSYLSDALLCSDTLGNFAVVWKNTMGSTVDIYSQRLDMSGVRIGVNTKVTDDQAKYLGYNKSIDMDKDGNFVIAWPDYRNNDTSFIYLQQMDKLGMPVGLNYRATTVNNGGPSQYSSLPSQIEPDVCILRDTIYLTWVNLNENVGNFQNIFASIQEWIIPDNTGEDRMKIYPHAFSVYPNPSDGRFTLKWDSQITGSLEISIFNSAGILVQQEELQSSKNAHQLHIKDFHKGIYLLKINGSSIHSSIPLVIN